MCRELGRLPPLLQSSVLCGESFTVEAQIKAFGRVPLNPGGVFPQDMHSSNRAAVSKQSAIALIDENGSPRNMRLNKSKQLFRHNFLFDLCPILVGVRVALHNDTIRRSQPAWLPLPSAQLQRQVVLQTFG